MVLGRGCGLGLTIAKRLKELAGGTFALESVNGAIVQLTFPMKATFSC